MSREIKAIATFTLTKAGSWRAQVRRKGVYAGESFLKKADAQDWARETELAIDKGLPLPKRGATPAKKGERTLADLIDLHLEDMAELKRRVPRSKAAVLKFLRAELGATAINRLTPRAACRNSTQIAPRPWRRWKKSKSLPAQ